jgi:predicted RecA/RadA family phage recombinase
LKDIQADILAVRAGLMTLKESITRQGYDPAQMLAEIGVTNAELDVLGIVTANPIMGDGVALFHANHKNLAATGSALDMASLGKARAAMARQTRLEGKTVLNIRPAFLVVPSSLELTAELEILTEGVIEIAKTSVLQIDVGDRLFWDVANKVVNKTATAQVCAGIAVSAAANPSPSVRIKLGANTPAGT